MVSKDQCVKALADAIDEFARLPDNPIVVGKGSKVEGGCLANKNINDKQK